MARQWRIAYSNAIYHEMSRGNEGLFPKVKVLNRPKIEAIF